MTSIGADLPRQMARVARLAVSAIQLPHHALAVDLMLEAVDLAAEATASQDVVGMVRAHQLLIGFRL